MAIDPSFEQSLIDEFLFMAENVTHGIGDMPSDVEGEITQLVQNMIDGAYNAGFADGQSGAPMAPPWPEDPAQSLDSMLPQQTQVLMALGAATLRRAYSAGYQDGMAAPETDGRKEISSR